MTADVAVVGAGMAGAACARALADAGLRVRVLDKGRSVGGRMAQRRVAAGVFDHGAQYLSASDPAFSAEVERWRRQGLVADWDGVASASGRPVLVGVPAMNAPVKALLDGLPPVAAGTRVTELAHGAGGWTLATEGGERQGPFAAVALAVPAPQAVALVGTARLERVAGLILRLGAVRMAPCWTGLAAFGERLPVEPPSLRLDGALAWAARNGGKPGRGEGEAWTLHAGPEWSTERSERRPEEVALELAALLAAAVGAALPEPVHLSAHRWRYALVQRPLGQPCAWDPLLRLGLCGDWCLGPRVEAAYLSGRALAAAALANGGVRL